jgi:hypothetical protein
MTDIHPVTDDLPTEEEIIQCQNLDHIVVTQQPANSHSPLPSWSNSVAQTWLIPPFGQ